MAISQSGSSRAVQCICQPKPDASFCPAPADERSKKERQPVPAHPRSFMPFGCSRLVVLARYCFRITSSTSAVLPPLPSSPLSRTPFSSSLSSAGYSVLHRRAYGYRIFFFFFLHAGSLCRSWLAATGHVAPVGACQLALLVVVCCAPPHPSLSLCRLIIHPPSSVVLWPSRAGPGSKRRSSPCGLFSLAFFFSVNKGLDSSRWGSEWRRPRWSGGGTGIAPLKVLRPSRV